MTNGELIDRAVKAKAILESPIYQASWDACRTAIIDLLEKTPIANVESAQDLRRSLKILKDVRANLEGFLAQGKVAEFKLSNERTPEQARAELKRGIIRGLFR